MSDDLPDDVESWPRDPYSLLGVDFDTDFRDVKRQYLRLVKRFKPDQAPAAFQRIREAYEQIQARNERSRPLPARPKLDETPFDRAAPPFTSDDRPVHSPRDVERRVEPTRFEEPTAETPETESSERPSADLSERNESQTIIDRPARIVNSAPFTPLRDTFDPVVAEFAESDDDALPPIRPAAPTPPVPSRSFPRHLPELTLAQIWEVAVKGQGAEAYAQFQRCLQRRREKKSDVCVRLYWLLLADPRLDPSRSPYHWLLDALREADGDQRTMELYRRELFADASIANDPLAADLPSRISLELLPSLLKARWLAFYRRNLAHAILRDLEMVRPRLKFDSDEAWAELILEALGYLLFLDVASDDSPAFWHWREEFGHLAHVVRDRPDLADRLDGLLMIQPGWKRLATSPTVPPAWRRLVVCGWFSLFRTSQDELQAFLSEIVTNPTEAFTPLDEMEEAGSFILEQIAILVRAYGDRQGRAWPKRVPADLANSANLFRSCRGNSSPYVLVRLPLLYLCLSEAAMPEDFLDYFQDYDWVSNFEKDNVMRLILHAHSVLDG